MSLPTDAAAASQRRWLKRGIKYGAEKKKKECPLSFNKEELCGKKKGLLGLSEEGKKRRMDAFF